MSRVKLEGGCSLVLLPVVFLAFSKNSVPICYVSKVSCNTDLIVFTPDSALQAPFLDREYSGRVLAQHVNTLSSLALLSMPWVGS